MSDTVFWASIFAGLLIVAVGLVGLGGCVGFFFGYRKAQREYRLRIHGDFFAPRPTGNTYAPFSMPRVAR